MSLNLNYFDESGQVATVNDIASASKQHLTEHDCKQFYFAHSPMGWYNDLGATPIGNRPVWKSFRVGNCTKTTPTNWQQSGNWGCSQPCWNPNCK
tara:strand:+ start:9213 stop:9497 length:285 start_codon:yes stop_codon:yes gene_type:complete